MSIAEFMGFVLAVCNVHSSHVSTEYKEQCAIWWSNCAISDPDTVDRRKLNMCLEKMKTEKSKW